MVVELRGGEERLVVSSSDGWCKLWIEREGARIPLGADSEDVLLKRLLVALSDELTAEPVGEIDGMSVGWVASLSEEHGSIYVASLGTQRVLLFQDRDGELVGRIDLDVTRRNRWRCQLQDAQDR